MAAELFGVALRIYIFTRRIFRRTFAGIFQVVIGAEKFYLLSLRDDVDTFCRIFLLADLREGLRRIVRDKYGSSTFAARIFIYNRHVNIFIYAVSMLQIRATDTSIAGLFRRQFLLGVLTSPAGDNVFKQVVSRIRAADDCAEYDNFFLANGVNVTYN